MKKFLPKTSTNTQGFTLIELLVVIAIIAILSIIGVTVFSGVQKNARDARRKGDIDAIAKALEAGKTVGSSTYNSLSATTSFAGGAIPTDTTTAQYSVAWSTTAGAAAPAIPTAWAISPAVPNPTAPGTWATVNATTPNPPATATAWTVCALLENGANPTVYCKQSAQ